jgi:hypothetical protein
VKAHDAGSMGLNAVGTGTYTILLFSKFAGVWVPTDLMLHLS